VRRPSDRYAEVLERQQRAAREAERQSEADEGELFGRLVWIAEDAAQPGREHERDRGQKAQLGDPRHAEHRRGAEAKQQERRGRQLQRMAAGSVREGRHGGEQETHHESVLVALHHEQAVQCAWIGQPAERRHGPQARADQSVGDSDRKEDAIRLDRARARRGAIPGRRGPRRLGDPQRPAHQSLRRKT
jgi:hypothetical protein